MKRSESWHQVKFFARCAELAHIDARYKCIFSIPMGGRRDVVTGANMKAQGARRGVPDIFVAVAVQGKHGLFIEMKVAGGRLSSDQNTWRDRLKEQGYGVAVCYSHEEALNTVALYFGRADLIG